jgi:hypothetical protein
VYADLYAPTVVWDNGNADGDWDLDTGWSTGFEPTASDKVAVDNGRIITISQSGEVADEIRVASTSASSGTLRVLSGDLTFRLGEIGDEGTGVVNQLGGAVTSTNRLWIGSRGPGYDALGQGTYNLSAGTVDVQGTASTAMRVGRAGATGTLNISGGTFTTAGQFNIAAQPAAEGLPSKGTVNLSGTGVLNVGTTLLNDATGTDPGEALLTLSGSNVTVTALSYAHRPDATLSFIADAAGVSPITVIDGPGGVSIQDGDLLLDLSAMTATPGVIVLIDNQQPDPISGAFLNAPEGTLFGDYMLTYLYDGGDGDANDLALVLALLTGDLDGDGFVGIGDLNAVLGNWNQNVTPGSLIQGDPSGDGFVGIEDLNTVLGNWNTGTPPVAAAVPEPASLAVLGLCASLTLRRRS